MSNRTRISLSCLAVSTMLALPGPSRAQTGGKEPGVKWEQTVEMQMQGFSMPPTTSKFCAPKKDWKEPPKAGRDDDSCKISDVKHDGPRMTWKMACQGKEPMTGEGEMVQKGDGYTGQMTMHSSHGDMVMKITGRNLGEECDAGEMKRTAEAYKKQAEEGQAAAAAGQAKACDEAVKTMSTSTFTMTDVCKARKGDFCAHLGTPAGYSIVAKRSPDEQSQAAKMCNANLETVRAGLCSESAKALKAPGSATDPAKKADVSFVYGYCPDEARALAQRDCAGKSFTGMEPNLLQFCVKYAQDSQAKKPSPPPATPQEAAQKNAEDAAKKAVKGVFGF